MTEPGGSRRHRTPWLPHLGSVLAAAAVLGGCTLPPLATPTPRPSPSATPSPAVTGTAATTSPSPTPESTPDRGAIPDLAAGEIAVTLIDGLRVRQRPGTEAPTVTGLLPAGAELEVVMGPFPAGEFGWYLVTDADPEEPAFEEGWIAAGYEPEPLVTGTGRAVPDSPYLFSMAASGAAEEGPVEIDDGEHLVRWIAADPEGVGCRFAVSLVPPSGEAVPTVRATVGAGIDRGTLQPQTFAALGVTGPAFVSVESDCDWALVVARPAASDGGSPAPSSAP